MMSDLIFVLSNNNGDLVGHMSFQEKKLFAALQYIYNMYHWCTGHQNEVRTSVVNPLNFVLQKTLKFNYLILTNFREY